MSLFDRKKVNVPEWASFFSEEEYTTFLEAIGSYFRKTLNISYEIHDGVINLVDGDNLFGLGQFGLVNLAQNCKQNKPTAYREIIANHFGCLIESVKFKKEFAKIEKDFEKVKDYIAVRLYDKEYLSSGGMNHLLIKNIAGELFAALVFDFPRAVVTVSLEEAAPWGKTIDELFEIGLENIRRSYRINREIIESGEEKDAIIACEAEHFFVPNILFDLDKHNEFVGKGGALVAAPTRNIVLIYPINDFNVVRVLNNFFNAAFGLYSNNPGRLTKEVYWYKDGKFTQLPYEIDGDKKENRFKPPQEFIDLLLSLT